MKLNTAVKHPVLRTHQGAPAVRTDALSQLRRSVMNCMLWEKEFYEDGVEIAERILSLVPQCVPEQVALLALDARTKMKLRHVPLLIVAGMTKHPKHKALVSDLLHAVIHRADELAEFMAIYFSPVVGSKTVSAQVKKGLARAFTKFSEYDFAKYNRDGAWKLRDVLFLSHAKPADALGTFDRGVRKLAQLPGNSSVLPPLSEGEQLFKRIVDNTLSTPDTWEVALSGLGNATPEQKREVWSRLLAEKKLGALAFLRNLRNMHDAGVSCEVLTQYAQGVNTKWVLPFRYTAAARAVPALEPMLEPVMLKSLAEHTQMAGRTVLMVDVSGSMGAGVSGKSDITRLDAACALAVLLREICRDVRIVTFSDRLAEVPPRRGFALRDAIVTSQGHGGTYLGQALRLLNVSVFYDRLIVITDEQSADALDAPHIEAKAYMVNVASARNGVGYGAWHHIDGWSEAIVDYIQAVESADAQPL